MKWLLSDGLCACRRTPQLQALGMQAVHEKSSMDERAGDKTNRHCICQTYGDSQAGMLLGVVGLA